MFVRTLFRVEVHAFNSNSIKRLKVKVRYENAHNYKKLGSRSKKQESRVTSGREGNLSNNIFFSDIK